MSDFHFLCGSWGYSILDDNDDVEFSDFKEIHCYLSDFIIGLKHSPFAVPFEDEVFKDCNGAIYEGGFRYGQYEFTTYYTGSAGNYWYRDGLIK